MTEYCSWLLLIIHRVVIHPTIQNQYLIILQTSGMHTDIIQSWRTDNNVFLNLYTNTICKWIYTTTKTDDRSYCKYDSQVSQNPTSEVTKAAWCYTSIFYLLHGKKSSSFGCGPGLPILNFWMKKWTFENHFDETVSLARKMLENWLW